MLYLLTNATEYTGQFQDGDSEAARAALIVMGLRPVWMDGTPAFHQRWVETPAAEGEDEIRITLTVGELREVRLAELDHIAGQYDQYKCNSMYVTSSVDGNRYNADIRSQTNIKGVISQLNDDTATERFKDYDNVFRNLNRIQLAVIYDEAIKNGKGLYQQKFGYQAAIAAAETIEELEEIKVEFEMMDFSK